MLAGREVRLEEAAGGVDATPCDAEIEREALYFLGAELDVDAFAAFAQGDETLARVVELARGYRPTLQPDPFEALVTSITAQQVSLQSAAAIRSRFIERFGVRHEHAWAFPLRDQVAGASEDELLALGFSGRKAEYVLGLARSDLDFDGLRELPDEEVTARLVAVRGLGEWTAEWFLARHLARPRAWPAGDLGLRRAVERFCAGGRPLTTPDVRELGARFAPYENLSAQYLLLALRATSPRPADRRTSSRRATSRS